MEARIRELEAENQRLTEFGEAAVIHAAESNDQIDVIEALAAQIEAADEALDKSLCGSMPDHDAVYGILSADSEVRARILAEHDARVLEEAADAFAVVPHPYEGGVTGWLRARAAEKREEQG
ncbi:hypothetical protein [Agromyces larvae]|uniref:Ead/Ea22-like family protein n=1 Tax=Agromyces larvae TaxID=2929802 RepID=A0ABY4C236_9MICO|nr:hypothetical protein [Agromyces larvae]UOE45502.1 hypothetical protein MTO99_07020 [Agromyces larvae]